MKSFSEYFPFTEFQRMAEFMAVYTADSKRDWRTYHAMLKSCLVAPLKAYLADRHAAEPFAPVDLKGHSLRWAQAWNLFTETGLAADLPNLFDLAYDLETSETNSRPRAGSTAENPVDPRAAYESLVARVAAGDFPAALETSNCGLCGARLYSGFTAWQPFVSEKHARVQPPALSPCQYEPGLKEVMIKVTSGEILVADWFRIPEFTEIVDANKPSLSINYLAGETALTEHYADNFGFLSVFVGNSSPPVYVNRGQDRLLVGHLIGQPDEDPDDGLGIPGFKEDYTDKGRICTDLWWATLIDPQQLLAILATRLGLQPAADRVKAYLDENRTEYLRIPLKNGVYRIRYGNDEELRAALLHGYGLTGERADQLDLLMERIADAEIDYPHES